MKNVIVKVNLNNLDIFIKLKKDKTDIIKSLISISNKNNWIISNNTYNSIKFTFIGDIHLKEYYKMKIKEKTFNFLEIVDIIIDS